MNKIERIEKLEQELAELKAELDMPELKKGDWVVTHSGSYPSTYRLDENIDEYGCAYVDKTISRGQVSISRNWIERKATKEEIEQALIKEAKRRGFVGDEIKFKSAWNGTVCHLLKSNGFKYDMGKDCLYQFDNLSNCVYQNGKWAEIDDNKIEVNGYEAEFKKGYVRFGCAEIENSLFEEINQFIDNVHLDEGEGNRSLTHFKIGKGLFDIKTIQEINKRLK